MAKSPEGLAGSLPAKLGVSLPVKYLMSDLTSSSLCFSFATYSIFLFKIEDIAQAIKGFVLPFRPSRNIADCFESIIFLSLMKLDD